MTITNPQPVAIGFPNQGWWIPDVNQIRDTGELILRIAGAVLDQTEDDSQVSRGNIYQRRVLSTGQEVPVVPEMDGQLIVSVFEMALGRAGEQRFQFFKGTMGAYAQKFVRFQVELVRASPTIKSGIGPRMQDADDLAAAASELWTDAWLVWSALLATALGGVNDSSTGQQISPAPLTQDNLLIGAMTLDPPQGGLASAKCEVQVQM